MKIEYENRFFDLYLFNLYRALSSAVTHVFFLAAPVLFLYFQISSGQTDLGVSLITALLIYVGSWTMNLIYWALFFISKDKSFYRKHVIEATDNGVVDETEVHKTEFYWKGLSKIVCRPGLVLIWVTPHSALLIPTRAFISAEEMKQFIEFCAERIIRKS